MPKRPTRAAARKRARGSDSEEGGEGGGDEAAPKRTAKKDGGKAGGARTGTNRRLTHNISEQKRARRIKEQIESLHALMLGAGLDRGAFAKFAPQSTARAHAASRVGLVPVTLSLSQAPPRVARIRSQSLPLAVRPDKFSVLAAAVQYTAHLQRVVSEQNAEIRRLQSRLELAEADAGSARRAADDPAARVTGMAEAICGLDGKFIDCNAAFCRLTGFNFEEVFENGMFTLTRQADMPKTFKYATQGELVVAHNVETDACSLARMVNDLMASKDSEPRDFEKVCVFKNGKLVPVFVRIRVARAPDGKPKHFVVTLTDNSEGSGAAMMGASASVAPASTPTSTTGASVPTSSNGGSATSAGAGAGGIALTVDPTAPRAPPAPAPPAAAATPTTRPRMLSPLPPGLAELSSAYAVTPGGTSRAPPAPGGPGGPAGLLSSLPPGWSSTLPLATTTPTPPHGFHSSSIPAAGSFTLGSAAGTPAPPAAFLHSVSQESLTGALDATNAGGGVDLGDLLGDYGGD